MPINKWGNSMNEPVLGKLERVDLKSAWPTEDGDFTPWLAREGNLALLGDAVGIEDLELEATEKNVGPFRADILCKDIGTGNWVLIENQLERTDHKHLGQLLTYAAGLQAVTIVWIAAPFTEEHRATLNWLNGITDERFRFFGLEIELWKIGDSAQAPKFNIVSAPNDWSKSVSKAANAIAGEVGQLQLEFWTQFRSYLVEHPGAVKPVSPFPQNWLSYGIGRTHFALHTSVNVGKKWVSVTLNLSGPDPKPHFHLLFQDKDAIERKFGGELDWRELPDKKDSQIRLQFFGEDPNDRDTWPRLHSWLADTLEAFHGTFSQRVKSLQASDYEHHSA